MACVRSEALGGYGPYGQTCLARNRGSPPHENTCGALGGLHADGARLLLGPQEMASRHRVRYSSLSIIKTATVPAALCKRDGTKQFHNSKIAFPVTQKLARCAPML